MPKRGPKQHEAKGGSPNALDEIFRIRSRPLRPNRPPQAAVARAAALVDRVVVETSRSRSALETSCARASEARAAIAEAKVAVSELGPEEARPLAEAIEAAEKRLKEIGQRSCPPFRPDREAP